MPSPSDDEVKAKLRQRGAAEHVIRAGADGLIAGWRQFVASVEQGYSLGLEDYRNDLDTRGLIAAVGLETAVLTEDERLRRVLVTGKKAIWESDVPEAFWVLGYPGNASGELLADLRAEGIA